MASVTNHNHQHDSGPQRDFLPCTWSSHPCQGSFVMLQSGHRYDVKGCLVKAGLGEAAIEVQ
ncbi:hypothetical protein [Candidatus Nitrososphaera sp. FF02]|uniref:hypothetical protein n=1 Tax=Candidatus Nitrososphaera sp. FF02 TaxID=3398226 RepID=UPI0039E7A39C